MANAERQCSSAPQDQGARSAWRGAAVLVACALASAVGLAASMFVLHLAMKDGNAATPANSSDTPVGQDAFASWGTPDVVLLLTGEMHGYLQPCGCSRPQVGGLSRRYNFIQGLKAKGWNVVSMDLGDISQTTGAVADQRQLKYSTAMKALDLMGYTAVGIGSHEFQPQLFETLSNYSLNHPTPTVVATNLLQRNPGEIFHNLNVKSLAMSPTEKGPKVGVVSMMGPSVIAQIRDPDAKFTNNNAAALEQALLELKKQRAEVYALLYQGSKLEAVNLVKYFSERHRLFPQVIPTLDVVLCLSEASEPPSLPGRYGNTLIVEIGHKGRYVGVVGVYGNGPQRSTKYQLASIGEEFEAAGNPVKTLMETYAGDVKRNNYIAQYPRAKHPLHVQFPQAKYVGSEICGNCHPHAHNIWSNSKHAHAFDTLKSARDPGHRDSDGECVRCHVVGFGYHTGYLDARNGARVDRKLQNVGCEVCHGPGSAHTNDPNNAQLHALMNPYKTTVPGMRPEIIKNRQTLIDVMCQRCHDTDNDVHWTFDKWVKIAHPTPPANPVPADNAKP